MAFARNYKRFTYTADMEETWQPGSFWQFRTDLSDVDDDYASELITESILNQVTVGEVQEAVKDGKDLNEFLAGKVSKRVTLNDKRAFLVAKTVQWGGFDNMVPEDYQDDSKEPIGTDEDGEPVFPIHEDAGKIAPITPFWVGVQEPEVIDRVYAALKERLQGRSASEQKEFPASADSVDRPRRKAKSAKEAPAAE